MCRHQQYLWGTMQRLRKSTAPECVRILLATSERCGHYCIADATMLTWTIDLWYLWSCSLTIELSEFIALTSNTLLQEGDISTETSMTPAVGRFFIHSTDSSYRYRNSYVVMLGQIDPMCCSHGDNDVTFTVQRISTLSEILTLDDPSVCGKILSSMLMGRKLLVSVISTDMSAGWCSGSTDAIHPPLPSYRMHKAHPSSINAFSA